LEKYPTSNLWFVRRHHAGWQPPKSYNW
jgi:hypothetical protein